jgi:hypothetical protein
MRGLRFLGGRVRGGNLALAVAVLAVLVVASGHAAMIQDLLTVTLIALSLLTAGVLALFVVQVRMARQDAVHPVRARAVPAPRPAPAARPLLSAPPPHSQAGPPQAVPSQAGPPQSQARHARPGPGDESVKLSHASAMQR